MSCWAGSTSLTRHAATDLRVADADRLVRHERLGLDKVGDVAIVIDAARVEARAGSLPAQSADECQRRARARRMCAGGEASGRPLKRSNEALNNEQLRGGSLAPAQSCTKLTLRTRKHSLSSLRRSSVSSLLRKSIIGSII